MLTGGRAPTSAPDPVISEADAPPPPAEPPPAGTDHQPNPTAVRPGIRCIFPDCLDVLGSHTMPTHVRNQHPEVATPAALTPGAPGYDRIHDALAPTRRWLCVKCQGVNSAAAASQTCRLRTNRQVCGGPRYVRGTVVLLADPAHPVGATPPPTALRVWPGNCPLEVGTVAAYDALIQHHSRTLAEIPPSAMAAWTRALVDSLSAIRDAPRGEVAWFDLLSLPKLILAHPPRSASRAVRANAPSVAAHVLARLEMWNQGREGRTALLHERLTQEADPGPRARSADDARALARCRKLAEDGRLGDATQALAAGKLAPATADNVAALRALHPAAPPPRLPAWALPAAFVPSHDDVLAALKSFKRRVASGASGMYAEHIRDAVTQRDTAAGGTLLHVLHAVCVLLAAGNAPPSVMLALTTSPLVALAKEGGGLRPIAIGEVLRRLVSKLAMARVRHEAQAYLEPHQVGVGTRGGGEAVVHAAQALVLAHGQDSTLALLKVDFRNAFNRIDRTTFFHEVRIRCPSISAWVEACYGGRNPLLFGAARLEAQAGVQQGDPLGPLLFALALQPVIERIHTEVGLCVAGRRLALNAWYLDDGALVGTPEQLRQALAILQDDGPSLGLELHATKCELWWPQLGAGAASSLPLALTTVRSGGVALLGAPLGDGAFAEEFVGCRVAAIDTLLEKSRALNDPQLQLALTRQCILLPRFNHALRTCNPALIPNAIRDFDGISSSILTSIVGPMTEEARVQAGLPVSEGGLAIAIAGQVARPAFLGSVIQTQDPTSALLGEGVPGRSDFDGMWERFVADHPRNPPLTLALVRKESAKPQQWLAAVACEKAHASLMARASALPVAHARPTLARLRSLRLPHCSGWLLAPPTRRHRIPAMDFRLALRYRLGLVLGHVPPGTLCAHCPGEFLDDMGVHAASCNGRRGRKARHNAGRDALAEWAKPYFFCDGGVVVEPPALLPDAPQLRPADVLLRGFGLTVPGRACCVDLTYVNSGARSCVAAAAARAGGAMRNARRNKRGMYAEKCEEQNLDYFVFAIETHGGVETTAEVKAFLRMLAERRVLERGGTVGEAVADLMMHISVASMRSLGATLRSRFGAVQPLALALPLPPGARPPVPGDSRPAARAGRPPPLGVPAPIAVLPGAAGGMPASAPVPALAAVVAAVALPASGGGPAPARPPAPPFRASAAGGGTSQPAGFVVRLRRPSEIPPSSPSASLAATLHLVRPSTTPTTSTTALAHHSSTSSTSTPLPVSSPSPSSSPVPLGASGVAGPGGRASGSGGAGSSPSLAGGPERGAGGG